jgi:hypothetical protein
MYVVLAGRAWYFAGSRVEAEAGDLQGQIGEKTRNGIMHPKPPDACRVSHASVASMFSCPLAHAFESYPGSHPGTNVWALAGGDSAGGNTNESVRLHVIADDLPGECQREPIAWPVRRGVAAGLRPRRIVQPCRESQHIVANRSASFHATLPIPLRLRSGSKSLRCRLEGRAHTCSSPRR